jgi:hypothetical protein
MNLFQKFFIKQFLLILVLGVFLSIPILSSDREPILVPKSKVPKLLKSVAYATIRSTLLHNYQFGEVRFISPADCPQKFPSLPGFFGCHLLEFPETSDSISTTTSTADSQFADGELDIQELQDNFSEAKTKSAFINGRVAKINRGEKEILTFYLTNGFLSHYKFKDQLVIFKWRNDTKKPSLSALIIVKLGMDNFPETVYEYQF